MRLALILVLSLSTAAPAPAADRVRLQIQDGRVWLSAADATVPEILAEWSRVGSTRITNAERLRAPRVTTHVEAMPEAQALDLLLRSTGGYVAVSRVDGPATASQFAQIVIIEKSPGAGAAAERQSVPPPLPAPAVPALPPAMRSSTLVRPLIGPDGRPVPDDQDEVTPVYAQPPAPPARAPRAPLPGYSLRPGEPTGQPPPSPQPRRSPDGA
jgi:hypothetical protein